MFSDAVQNVVKQSTQVSLQGFVEVIRNKFFITVVRGTQRQFLENVCSEDDLSSRIFGTFVVK